MEEFRQIMPLVDQIGDAGMQKTAAHYYAVAKDWWGERPGLAGFVPNVGCHTGLYRTFGFHPPSQEP